MNKIISSLFVLLIFSFHVAAQNETIILPKEPFEQVALYTDRDIYLSGEKIWFNAICFTSEETSDIQVSNILYVELYNGQKIFHTKKKFKISDGQTCGSIDIPSSFASGNYYLRAYTYFQKNYPPELFFTSLVTIINPSTPLPEKFNHNVDETIVLIPDGGSLLEGIPNKVAYRIPTKFLNIIKDIIVTDNENNKADNLVKLDKGYGFFEINTVKNTDYFFKIITTNNDTIITKLPQVKDDEIIIRSNTSSFKNRVILNIVNKLKSEENQLTKYKLIIRSSDLKAIANNEILLENEVNNFVYNAENLSKGLHYVVLKDSEGNILKVSSFYNLNDEHKLDIRLPKQIFAPRELVKLSIDPVNFNTAEYSNISISVVKKGTSKLKEFLLNYTTQNPQVLASYLQGFNINEILNQDELNYLLICFNNSLEKEGFYPKLLVEQQKEFRWLPETRDVSISGVVLNKTKNIPIPNIPVFASVFKGNPQFHLSRTNDKGEFVFSLNNYVNNQEVFLLAQTPVHQETEFKINNDFSNRFTDTNEIPLIIDSTEKKFYEEMYINMQAGKSFKTEIGSTELLPSQFPYAFSNPQTSISFDDYIITPDMETTIKEIVPDVRLHKERGKYALSVINKEKLTTYNNPLILVDNIPITDVGELLKIPTSNIERIEIYKEPLILGDNLIKGVFMVITNTNNFGGITPPKGSVFMEYQTVSSAYAFDPRIYDNESKKKSGLADFRNLLYWNPDMDIDEKRNVSFYTSDHCSEYDIIIRGIKTNGETFYQKTSIRVEK